MKLKWSLIHHWNWSVTIQALTPRALTLKINQGTKIWNTQFDVTIFWLVQKYLGHNFNWAKFKITAFPRIIVPLFVQKRKYRPRLLFEKIRYAPYVCRHVVNRHLILRSVRRILSVPQWEPSVWIQRHPLKEQLLHQNLHAMTLGPPTNQKIG